MKIHHIGFVVKSINKYKKAMPYNKSLKKVYDKIQMANLELIEIQKNLHENGTGNVILKISKSEDAIQDKCTTAK